MSKLHQLHELGQSTWLNYMRRRFIQSGELRNCLNDGIQGVTANAAVFEDTISNHSDYDQDIFREVRAGTPITRIHEALMVDDVQRAADLLHPIFEASEGLDGFASVELDPSITVETNCTVATARRMLFNIDRGNAMVEVPASHEGIQAVKALTADGISINVTHIFSISDYERVAQIYIAGLESYFQTHSVWRKVPTAVASFSISPIDAALDPQLKAKNRPDLCGLTGIALARLLYARFLEIFSGPRWAQLAARGAFVLRPKWTRTLPYSAEYPDNYYTEQLIGGHTVVTFNQQTMDAFLEDGKVERTIDRDLDRAREHLDMLGSLGIDLDAVTEGIQLQHFADSDKRYQALIRSVMGKLYLEAQQV